MKLTRCTLLLSLLVAAAVQVSAFTAPQLLQRHGTKLSALRSKAKLHTANSAIHHWKLHLASENNDGLKSGRPFYLDPGTKGGAVVLSLVAFIVPLIFYQFVTNVFGVDGLEAGKWIGGGFTVVATLAWVSTYIFRVATKDMTYAKQLKDYENAVIAKRLEELDEDELQALVEEVERDDF